MHGLSNFRFFHSLILPPPLPSLLSLLMVAGLWQIARAVQRALLRQEDAIGPALYLATVGLFAAGLHLIASFCGPGLAGLRLLGWALAALGIANVVWLARRLIQCIRRWSPLFLGASLFDKLLWVGCGVLLLGFVLLALVPATDADSLDYHLGFGLEFLRAGAFPARDDWFSARLYGLGEMLNLLGLAGGTDNFGSVLQFSGLVAILTAFVPGIPSLRGKLLFAMGLLSCPVLLFLAPAQKSELLPAAAVSVSLWLTWRKKESLEGWTALVICVLCFFAMATKYAFYVPGTVVLLILVWHLAQAHRFSCFILVAAAYGVVLLPLQLQKSLLFGDPLTPLLEFLKAQADSALLEFAAFLHHYELADRAFPLNLILPGTPGKLSTVLGAGLLGLWLLRRRGIETRRIFLLGAVASAVGLFLAGARSARYYLAPFIWLLFASLSLYSEAEFKQEKRGGVFAGALFAQSLCVLLFMGYGVATLLPGALTARGRLAVLRRAALDYSVMEWADQVLPADARIWTTFRSVVFYPRPYVHRDRFVFTDPTSAESRRRLQQERRRGGLNTVVTEYPLRKDVLELLQGCRWRMEAPPRQFQQAARNPFNRAESYQAAILRLLPFEPERVGTGGRRPQAD